MTQKLQGYIRLLLGHNSLVILHKVTFGEFDFRCFLREKIFLRERQKIRDSSGQWFKFANKLLSRKQTSVTKSGQ